MRKCFIVFLTLMITAFPTTHLKGMSFLKYLFTPEPSIDELLSTHAYETLNAKFQAEVASSNAKRRIAIGTWVKENLAKTPAHPFLLYADAYITLHNPQAPADDKITAASNLIFIVLQSRAVYDAITTDLHQWFSHELLALCEHIKHISTKTFPHAIAINLFSDLTDKLSWHAPTTNTFIEIYKKLFVHSQPPRDKRYNIVNTLSTKMNDLCMQSLYGLQNKLWAEFLGKTLPRLCAHLENNIWVAVPTPSAKKDDTWVLVSTDGRSKTVSP